VDWFLFSVLGAASLAVTGVIDKFILEKYVQNSHAYLIALIVLQQAFAAGIFLIVGSGFVFLNFMRLQLELSRLRIGLPT
jgi:hypothetical protein